MKRRWSGLQAVRVTPEESSSEVTSSSATLSVMSPANSLASTDIGDVDLEFWDLDLNAQNHVRGLTIMPGFNIQGQTIIANHQHTKSDTSSMSGEIFLISSMSRICITQKLIINDLKIKIFSNHQRLGVISYSFVNFYCQVLFKY